MKNSQFLKNRVVALGLALGWAAAATPVSAQCASNADFKEGTPQVLAPTFLDAWVAKYPTSTLPDRMDLLTGRTCNVCHHPPNFGSAGNCYRTDIAELLMTGVTIQDALDQLDSVDSDGDGVTNGVEALATRPEAGEVGYSPGLVGEMGTDPCGANPSASVSGVSETPAAAIPAVSDWGLVVLLILLLTSATAMIRRRAYTS